MSLFLENIRIFANFGQIIPQNPLISSNFSNLPEKSLHRLFHSLSMAFEGLPRSVSQLRVLIPAESANIDNRITYIRCFQRQTQKI